MPRAWGRSISLGLLLAATLADAASAQVTLRRRAPPPPQSQAPAGTPAWEAEVWPFPAPDPKSWGDDERPKPAEAADPLGGRKLGARERLTAVDSGVEPTLYRLWGLPPLQTQVLRQGEMILEVWTRPAGGVRQTVTRITVRRDGQAFVQARAGLACCEPGIARRVGFDAPLPDGAATTFLALREHPMWNAPRDVRVVESGGSSDAICVDGVAYDVTLVVPGRSRSLRRACDSAEFGQIADALEPALRAAAGHEPRIDVLFPRIDFSGARGAYRSLVEGGGTLKAAPDARAQPPTFEPAPEDTAPPPAG
ncbi:MAG: hypothetical protein Q8M88_11065 [Phenylobacterium sp.]|uniref:hypothetical protein n=1 Tax=Phenylobacterium sp. TaxID=1871053 RepID=UPI0027323017|nr:hypothetical protein [Phenylobacterium sp.]MDP3174960.1 hypothetical protein [Phenylobacterium sp.]